VKNMNRVEMSIGQGVEGSRGREEMAGGTYAGGAVEGAGQPPEVLLRRQSVQ